MRRLTLDQEAAHRPCNACKPMICPFHTELHAKRRKALLDAMAAKGPDAVAIFPSAPVYVRNNDVDHDYRQDSDLHYLTGFEEPGSVLVLSARDRKATMF